MHIILDLGIGSVIAGLAFILIDHLKRINRPLIEQALSEPEPTWKVSYLPASESFNDALLSAAIKVTERDWEGLTEEEAYIVEALVVGNDPAIYQRIHARHTI
jgi:hypothetical protein